MTPAPPDPVRTMEREGWESDFIMMLASSFARPPVWSRRGGPANKFENRTCLFGISVLVYQNKSRTATGKRVAGEKTGKPHGPGNRGASVDDDSGKTADGV